jgi:hypothetical protein
LVACQPGPACRISNWRRVVSGIGTTLQTVSRWRGWPMSEVGPNSPWGDVRSMSGLLPRADFRTSPTQVSTVPQADIGPSIRSKSSPEPENFFSKRLPQKGYPLSGAETVFGQVFGRGGMSNLKNPTAPPTGGSRLPHAHPSSFEMRRTVPLPTCTAGDGHPSKLISPEVAEPVG